MHTLSGQYARLLLERWQRATQGECTAVFFNVHDRAMFSAFLDRFLHSRADNAGIFRLSRTDTPLGPYAPLLDWSARRAWEKGDDIPALLARVGIYAPQLPVFTSYLVQGRAGRAEEVVHEEIPYEQEQVIDSLWRLFSFLNGEKTAPLLVLEDIGRLPIATFKAFIRLFSGAVQPPLLLVASLDDHDPELDERKRILCRQLMESAGIRSLTMTRAGLPSGGEQPLRQEITPALGRDCFHFLAYEDCRDILRECYRRHVTGKRVMDEAEDLETLCILGDAHRNLGEIDDALLVGQNLITLAHEKNARAYLARGYRRMGTAHLLKDDVSRAHNMAVQSLQLAQELGDEILEFEARLLLFCIEDKKRQLGIEEWRIINDDLLRRVKRLGWDNTLCFILSNQFGTFSRYSDYYRAQHDEGMRIAEALGNRFRLAVSWQIKGLIASVHGDYPAVINFYQQSLQIKKGLGNLLELAYINNGIGFFHYLTGMYGEALEKYGQALELLVRVKDFHEIGMTWFNMAAAFLLSFAHKESIRHLEALLSLLSIMDAENLSYHSRFGIYVLLGTAYCKAGDPDRAYEYLARIRIEKLKPYPQKNEEYFFYFVLRALVAVHDGNQGRAEKYFARADRFLHKTNDVILYLEPRFHWERAQALLAMGRKEQARQTWSQGKKNAAEKNNIFYKKIFSGSVGKPLPAPAPLSETNFDTILESCRTARSLTQLHYRINEISFLNAFQLAMAQEGIAAGELIAQAAQLIRSNFPVDQIQYHAHQDGDWTQTAVFPENRDPDDPVPPRVVTALVESGRPLFVDGYPGMPAATLARRTLISLPLRYRGGTKGHLLCFCNPDSTRIETVAVRVLLTAASQLAVALARLEQEQNLIIANQKLRETARTDLLTGLGNRAALHARLKEEEHRRARYGGDRKASFTLLFLDLDNFKYYNDTFGHLTGDKLLIMIASLIRSICRDVDFITRYGGDEFIILLPETDREGAVLLVRRLYAALAGQQFFQPELESILGKKITIPEGKRLGFSIGIAVYDSEVDENLEALLSRADRALYRSKEEGKNTFRISE